MSKMHWLQALPVDANHNAELPEVAFKDGQSLMISMLDIRTGYSMLSRLLRTTRPSRGCTRIWPSRGSGGPDLLEGSRGPPGLGTINK